MRGWTSESTFPIILSAYHDYSEWSAQRVANPREFNANRLASTDITLSPMIERGKQGYFSLNPTRDKWGSNTGRMHD